jgi:hypothetical protein
MVAASQLAALAFGPLLRCPFFGLRNVRGISPTSDQSDPVNTELKPLMLANAQDFQMNRLRLIIRNIALNFAINAALFHRRRRMLEYLVRGT